MELGSTIQATQSLSTQLSYEIEPWRLVSFLLTKITWDYFCFQMGSINHRLKRERERTVVCEVFYSQEAP